MINFAFWVINSPALKSDKTIDGFVAVESLFKNLEKLYELSSSDFVVCKFFKFSSNIVFLLIILYKKKL